MTVEQMIAALLHMPKKAVVLFEGDSGYSLVGGMALEENGNGMPDEVILFPSIDDDCRAAHFVVSRPTALPIISMLARPFVQRVLREEGYR